MNEPPFEKMVMGFEISCGSARSFLLKINELQTFFPSLFCSWMNNFYLFIYFSFL